MMGADSPETPNKNQLNAIKLSLAEVKMSGNNNIQPTDVLNFNGTFDFGDLDDFESAPGEGASILNKLNESKEPLAGGNGSNDIAGELAAGEKEGGG